MSSSGNSTVDPIIVQDDSEGIPSTALIENPTTDILSLFLIQVMLILIIVRLLAKVLAKLRQPPVIGEILAGVVLGPSILGQIPGFESTLFPTFSLATLQIFAQIGLIFFMFFLGLELDPGMFLRYWRSAFPIAVVSVLVPFALGCSLSPLLYTVDTFGANAPSHSAFTLFLGTTLAFTAFPLLARILTSFRLLDTAFGEHVLSIAAIDDILAWCTLALTLSYAGGATAANGVYTALITVAYLLVLVFITRPCLLWISRQLRFQQQVPGELNRDYVCVLILCLCASAVWTEISGIHAFFGAFTFGLIVPKEKQPDGESVVDILAPKIELLIVEFFLPLYFAYSGLRTNLASLNSGKAWGDALLVILVSSLGKIIPVTVMTRLMTRLRGIGDDFEQEDLDWEEEKRQREQTLHDKSDPSSPSHVALEMTAMPTPHGSSSEYSYHTYDTPAHKSLEEKVNPDAQPSSPSSSAPGGPESPSSSHPPVPVGPRSKAYSWRTCLSVGLLMNTTGLVTLVALNIGYDRGILGPKVFSMLVLMALVTTFMTSPFFHWLFYLPFIYERGIKREDRRREREEADRRAGHSVEAVAANAEERDAARAAEEAAYDAEAEHESDAISISSHPRRRRGVSANSPYSTNQIMHHILNPDREIKISTLMPPGQLTQSLTPPPHVDGANGRRRGSRSANGVVDGVGHGLRVSASDGELSDLRGGLASSDGDVYSNKVD